MEEDKAKMLMWLKRAVAEGDEPDALSVLGQMYLNGDEVDKDVALAVEYLEMAADLGHPEAQTCLGKLYTFGSEDVVQDVELGVEWLEEAEEQGNADAQATLGRHYHETEDYEKSISYWEKAAEQGHPGAQFGLGVCYSNGFGVEQNVETSLDFLLEAAEGGDEQVCKALGALCQHAISKVKEDETSTADKPEMAEFFRVMHKLADLDYRDAEFTLGQMCAMALAWMSTYTAGRDGSTKRSSTSTRARLPS